MSVLNDPMPPYDSQTEAAPETLIERSFWIRDATVKTQLSYVLKGIFGKGQIVVFWGAPGAGKTFLVMEMSCAIGAGVPWHGRRTRRGIVLYVAAESARAYIENRFSALKQERPDLAESDVLVVPLALDLLRAERGDVQRVVETAKELERSTGEVVLIVIDTLAVTFAGGNENSPDDMGAYVSNILAIREQTSAAVLLIHHSGKDEAKGMRGHSALLGALDAELAIDGAGGQERILRTGKVREGEGFSDLFAFKLLPVELGVDQDGDPVKSCVVQASDATGTQNARRSKKGATLGANQKAAIRVLEKFGGRMSRVELAHQLKADGMTRNRVYETIGRLVDSGMLKTHNEAEPIEVSIV